MLERNFPFSGITPPLSYAALYGQYRWPELPTFNIGVVACDRHADLRSPAIHLDSGQGHTESWFFSDLKQASNRLANALSAQGIRRGDRVAIFLSQSVELVIAHLATYKIGAVAVPLFTLFGPEALQYRVNDSEASVLITDSAHAEWVLDNPQAMPTIRHLVVTDKKLPHTHYWPDWLQDARDAFTPVVTSPDDPAIIIYTSGTTGHAKGALHGHRILLGHLPGVSLPHNVAPQPGDFFWTPADWAWIGGLFDVLFPALFWGLPVLAYRMPKFDPEEAFRLMERWAVKNVFLPPTAIKMMRQIPRPRDRYSLTLRSLASGGEPLGDETRDWALTELGIHINEFYGQTECNLVLSNSTSLFDARPNSMGKPVPGHHVTVIDNEGHAVGPGTVGEIAVKRPDPVMFLEYWRKPRETREKFLGDYLRTGDVGRYDEEGYFYFVGRDDDIISSSGYRIGPAEIEETLVKHPAVVMAGVVGVPDPLRGQIVKAYVQVKESAKPGPELARELQDWVKSRLAAYEYPRSIEFVSEFPMTLSGKIQRNLLRKKAEQDRLANPD